MVKIVGREVTRSWFYLPAICGGLDIHLRPFLRKTVFRDVRMQFCLALRFLVTLRPPLHKIFAFLPNIRPRLACMRTSRKTDFR